MTVFPVLNCEGGSRPPVRSGTLAKGGESGGTTSDLPMDTATLPNIAPPNPPPISEVFNHAYSAATKGGKAAAIYSVIQLCTGYPGRAISNYQFANGGTQKATVQLFWKSGAANYRYPLRLFKGIYPFFRGSLVAAIQLPSSRFVDVAVNEGAKPLLRTIDGVNQWPILLQQIFLSATTATIKAPFLQPLDTAKIFMVANKVGLSQAISSIYKTGGIPGYWKGTVAAIARGSISNYTYWGPFNLFNHHLPHSSSPVLEFLRNGTAGFFASVISDTATIPANIAKNTKQSGAASGSYLQIFTNVFKTEGLVKGIFGRGWTTRVVWNGLQSFLFQGVLPVIKERLN